MDEVQGSGGIGDGGGLSCCCIVGRDVVVDILVEKEVEKELSRLSSTQQRVRTSTRDEDRSVAEVPLQSRGGAASAALPRASSASRRRRERSPARA